MNESFSCFYEYNDGRTLANLGYICLFPDTHLAGISPDRLPIIAKGNDIAIGKRKKRVNAKSSGAFVSFAGGRHSAAALSRNAISSAFVEIHA